MVEYTMDTIKDENLPEAPASATVKIKTDKGFEWLFTARSYTDKPANNLIEMIKVLDEKFVQLGWENVTQGYGKKSDKPKHPDAGKVLNEKCQNCGGDMAISQKGKPYCKNLCWKN